MDLTVKYVSGVQFEVETASHRLVSDQPIENGGQNQGPAPPEFLLASLGTCVGYYALQYLKLRSLPAEGLTVTVTAEKAKQPARLSKFQVEVLVPGLEDRHVDGLTRAASACLIHNTLTSPPAISVVVHATDSVLNAAVLA